MFQNQTEKYKMRTPKHKKIMQKAKTSATGRLRKKAMKNKAFKKTLLDIGGDDTREDIRDLMNESDMSLNGFDPKEQFESGPSTVVKIPEIPLEPESSVGQKMSRAMTKSLSMVTMKTTETTDKLNTAILKKTKSLRSLRSKRKHSNEENMDKSSADGSPPVAEKRLKIEAIKEPLEEAARDPNLPPGLSIQEAALAKFAGVKNMLSSAVWGVPYAKVVEDPLEISVCEPAVIKETGEQHTSEAGGAEDNPANCIIT